MGGLSPLLFVGAGKMGGAILKCWLEAAGTRGFPFDPLKLIVQDPLPSEDVAALLNAHGIRAEANPTLTETPGLVVLAVKPQLMGEVLSALRPQLSADSVYLSIAAGKTLDDLAKLLPEGAPIVRLMPNTPVAVKAGMNVLTANAHVTAQMRGGLDALLAPTGAVAWLEDESLMDAVTAVSGSGPAYVFLMAECLARAGVEAGLDEALALTLARQTVYGAGCLMAGEALPPSVLRENVTSKGGTTAAALEVLMQDEALCKLFEAAVKAATDRSRDLSG